MAAVRSCRSCRSGLLLLTDDVVHAQGLNIAPALITVSPTKTVINPVGPLKIADAEVTMTLPALPGPDNNA